MKEFDLYLPLYQQDGKKISPRVYSQLRKELVKRFGGLTDFRHRHLGLWKFRSFVFKDEILIFRVLVWDAKKGRLFFKKLKRELTKQLNQKSLLIVEKSVRVL